MPKFAFAALPPFCYKHGTAISRSGHGQPLFNYMSRLLKFFGFASLFFSAIAMVPAAHAANAVSLGATWKYMIGTAEASNPTNAWRAISFDDSTWASGQAPIGYSTADPKNGFEATIATTIRASSTAPTWTTVYLRKKFTISSLANISGLTLNLYVDDGAVAWVNGVEVGRINVPDGELGYNAVASVADEQRQMTVFVPFSTLVTGDNVLAVQALNGNTTSSDFVVEAELSIVDDTAPTLESISPVPNAIILGLASINVIFSEPVTNVDAADLLINGIAATNVLVSNARDYTFTFAPPATGSVSIAFAPAHGIVDLDAGPTPFGGANWNYTVDPNVIQSDFIITEFMADNDNLTFKGKPVQDEDGDRSDWIEIHNPGTVERSISGWYLTDVQGSNKWRFPSHINLTIAPNGYLIVWASNKNRTNDPTRLHTNFQLTRGSEQFGGEYLGLLQPDGRVASEFAPVYPVQRTDISYGRDPADPNLVGYFDAPTPGDHNVSRGTGFAIEPVISLDSGVYTNDITVTMSLPPGQSGTIRYTVDGSLPNSTNSTIYSTPLTLTANTFVKARVFQNGVLPGPIVARAYFILDNTTRTFESNLPILVMNTSGRAITANVAGGAPRTKGSLVVVDTFRGRSSITGEPDFIGMAEFEIFGQTSASFPKVPYNIELQDEYGGDKSESLFGFPADADWKLRNPYSDKCMMNDFLATELFEAMGNYSVRRRQVEVFVDTGGGKLSYPGDYFGIYTFLEKIEQGKDRVNITELTPSVTTEPEITGGYMWKKDKPPADGSPEPTFSTLGGAGFGAQVLRWHEPKTRYITTGQSNWIRNYLIQFERCLYATDWTNRVGTNHYSFYADLDSFVDAQWIVEFPKQIDGYRLSNYMQKDRNGKIKMAPIWDWNLSFGNADYLEGGRTNGWYWALAGPDDHMGWLRRPLTGSSANNGTTGDPIYVQKLIDRWGQLRTNAFEAKRVSNRIDEIANLMIAGGAINRNFSKYNYLGTYQWPNPPGTAVDTNFWHVNYWFGITSYPQIISNMQKWVRGRYQWIDSQFVRAPDFNRGDSAVTPGSVLTMSAPAGTIYYMTDGTDPRLANGSIAPGAAVFGGAIIVSNNVRAVARARVGTGLYAWSPPTAATLYVDTPPLRITEIMYHPADPPQPFIDEDFEFIELRNVGASPLNISGYQIRGGIDFVFPTMAPLSPGQRVLVVHNLAAFSAMYDTNGMIVAGQFAGDNNLDNTGERLILEGRLREPIQDFRYDDDWYKITDGLGFSLVIADDSLPPSAWNDPANWRVGGTLNGTPGAGEPAPTNIPKVVINEVLTHTDLPSVDTIELYNAGSTAADISGWYLSDDRLAVKKFRIPNGTVIQPGTYKSFNEDEFNADGQGFALSSQGDEVYLASANPAGDLTGYLHGFGFGAQFNGVTFGRYLNSLQKEKLVAQAANTVDGANAGPLIRDVVISEFNYHPPDVFTNGAYWNNSEDEFIELYNRGNAPVNLYLPGNTNLVWKLDKAVEFNFPPGTSIPAGGYLVLVNFNPVTKPAMATAFRTKFNVPAQVPILGPLQGDLSNEDETVALYAPDAPETNINNEVVIPYVLIEEVEYSDQIPWSLPADGAGFSLHRRMPAQFSDDPIDWEGTLPTPGRGYTPGPAPGISAHPQSTNVLAGNPATFSVTASGTGPFRYQWRKNGSNILGQTNSSLTLNPTELSDAGDYQALVMNNSSYASSSNATLTVRSGVRILQHPASLTVRPPTNVIFSVTASSTSPIRYQWRFNGNILPNQTNNVLVLNNVTNIHEGAYDVVCTDDIGPVFSAPAQLNVLILPIMISPAPAAPLRVSAVVGETLTFSAQLHGSLPITNRWRLLRNVGVRLDVDDIVNTHFTKFTHVVAPNSAGRVQISMVNPAGGNFSTSVTNAFLTVLADTDGDHIPDDYENANGMNANDPADANGDLDGDGSKNGEEYIAGTDPRDPTSYLRVDRIETIGSAVLNFSAVSNRSYTVQFTDALSPLDWERLADFAPRTTNWSATAVDPTSPPQRYYRLVTPAQ